MNSHLKYIISLLIVITLFFACSRNRAIFERDKEKQKSEKTEPEKKDQYRIAENYSGNKSQVIDPIEGPATFDIEFKGDSAFVARLMDHDGNVIDVLADVKGPYKGTKSVTVPKTGSYILDVRCKGIWSVYRK